MTRRIIHQIRNISITILILLIVAVGVGVGYTWYTGRISEPEPPVSAVSVIPSVIKHVEPAANVQEGASIQMLTSPVIPGSNASVTIRTNPTSVCTISVIYDKTASTDGGLIAKTADEFGMVTWSWTVETAAPLGKWPVKITCVRGKLSAVVIGDLIVSKIE